MSKILVIDDDIDFVAEVRIVLESKGHEVVAAHSREEGMQAVDNVKADLIILDVMMELADDGFTVAHDLRKKGIETPILMLSSVGKVSGMTFDKDSDMVPQEYFTFCK